MADHATRSGRRDHARCSILASSQCSRKGTVGSQARRYNTRPGVASHTRDQNDIRTVSGDLPSSQICASLATSIHSSLSDCPADTRAICSSHFVTSRASSFSGESVGRSTCSRLIRSGLYARRQSGQLLGVVLCKQLESARLCVSRVICYGLDEESTHS